MCTGVSDLSRYLSRAFADIQLPSGSSRALRYVKIVGKQPKSYFLLGQNFSMMKTCLGQSVNPNLFKPKFILMSSKTQASVLLVLVFVHALLFSFAAPWDNPTT